MVQNRCSETTDCLPIHAVLESKLGSKKDLKVR
jgi:hypothetical protein